MKRDYCNKVSYGCFIILLADISMVFSMYLVVLVHVFAWIEILASMFVQDVFCKQQHVTEAQRKLQSFLFRRNDQDNFLPALETLGFA